MIDETTTLDQADEDILSYTVSDDALEAAAGIERVELSVPSVPGGTQWCVCSG